MDLRILYLCSSWPLGRAFGGQLRALQVGRALQQIGEVTVAVVSSDAKDIEAESRTGAEFALETPILPQIRPNQSISEKLRWALDLKHLNVHGFVATPADRERLIASFGKYDLVWVFNSRTPNILQRWYWPNAHLDIDDLPSTYARGERRNGASMARCWRACAQSFIAKRRELLFRERFTTLSVCSEADRQYLGGGEHVHVIPNGFERQPEESVRNPVEPPRIGFIGLYNYLPNLEGMKWFVSSCWPLIKQQVPNARLRLVGKDTDGALKPNAPDVDAMGYVADAASEIATWSAMIVPVRQGAGTRVKIADAFSRKCPVVSTHLGAYGYDVQSGRELLLADKPDDFAQSCVSLIRDRVAASAMADRAYAAFLQNWTWDAIAPRVWAAAEDALRRSSSNRNW